jgi:hypothetical protein
MMTSSAFSTSSPRSSRGRLVRGLSLAAAVLALASGLMAQDQTNRGRRSQNGDPNGGQNGGGRGNFDPQQMQQQMLERLRDQFGVTDDAEWKLISDKITTVSDLRRSVGGFGGRGGPGGGRGGDNGGGGGGSRRGGGSPEADALRQAVSDNLPEAEIKSRLARLRETRKANEEKLQKAQEDLRALLSVKQEAVAVMYGLLP